MPEPGPELVVQPGRLPEFWDRSAVFLANLAAMFFDNQGGFEQLQSRISGVATYGGRFVPIIDLLFTRGNNVLVLEAEPDHELLRYHERDLGLGIPEFACLDHWRMAELEKGLDHPDAHPEIQRLGAFLADHPVQWMDGFVTDVGLDRLARHTGMRTISSVPGSRLGNNKYLLHAHLEQQGLPVFETRMAGSPAEVPGALSELAALGFETAALKAQIGASGIGLVKVPVDAGADAAPDYLFHEGPVLVQGWIHPGHRGVVRSTSPSVQLFLDEKRVVLYDLTDQLLNEDSIHLGNISPPEFMGKDASLGEVLLRQAGIAGTWLHAQGYRGTASADFLVVHREDASRDVFMCELNARVTGATYPAMLARHFTPDGAWLMRNVRFPTAHRGDEVLRIMRRENLLYEPGERRGIIPINFNLDASRQVNKGQFLCLGADVAECLYHLAELSGAFSGGEYDRD